jgi:predicted AlkP superfamily phosphohydrolase/phosphomutase
MLKVRAEGRLQPNFDPGENGKRPPAVFRTAPTRKFALSTQEAVVGQSFRSNLHPGVRWSWSSLLVAAALCFLPACVPSRPAAGLPAKRLLLLGIDGMDPEILKRLVEEQKMPHFQRLIASGQLKPLTTSVPPQSPVAWSNFITGMNPGGHGVFDFIQRDPATMSLYFSTSKTEPGGSSVRFGDWVIPLSGGKVTLLRQGRSFWEILEEHGVPARVIRIPANFPPAGTKAVQLSGMGTPDLQGSYGTFSFYTNAPMTDYESISGGTVFPVSLSGQTIQAQLTGPRNDFRKGAPFSTIGFTVVLDAENPVAKIRLPDQEIQLAEKQWSDWVRVRFELIPWLQSVTGICRFYLKKVRPHFKLYVTPYNIDPSSPSLPISTPPSYAAELQEHIGMFYTQGIPEDTKALSSEVLDDAEFLQQTAFVMEEELKMLQHELQRFREGVLFFYFGRIDQLSHTFWRTMDPAHPAHQAGSGLEMVIENAYREMDTVLGRLLHKIDRETTLVVLSDHGFAPFYRSFHLNSWLKQEGYASLLDFSEGELLQNVDWKHTRVYSAGFNGLYLNLKGREKEGVVSAGEQEVLLQELTERLLALRDPKTGQAVVSRVYRGAEVYTGPQAKQGPDLIVGYTPGYRASWETALGKFPKEILRDNTDKWSGDHLIQAERVPGVLLSNRPIQPAQPSLLDLAPTILAEFKIAKPLEMLGRNLFSSN